MNETKNKNQLMLENAPYHKLILSLCAPTVIIMVVMTIYNMADTFFIGQTGDANKIAAISLCSPLFSILTGIGTLLGSGGCTSCSLAYGRGDQGRIKAIASDCLIGAVVLGLIFSAIVLSSAPAIAGFLGANAETLDFTVSYLCILAIGAPVILFSNIFTNLIRADGSAAQSMVSNLIGTVTNIVLDAVFILVFGWGVAGAAIATVIGNAAGSIFLIFYIIKKKPEMRFSLRSASLQSEIVVPLFTLGLPLCCSTVLMSISHIFSNNMMVSYGNTALAAQGVAGKVGMLISMTLMGICMGFGPAISYNYAGRNFDRMYEIIRKTITLSVVVGTVLSVVCFLARNPIVAAFIDDPEVIGKAQIMVFASLITGPFYGIYQICQTFLQSTGKAGYATLVSALEKGIIFLPALFIMNRLFGMYGIIFTGCISMALSLVVAIFLSLKWNREINGTVKAAAFA